MERLLKEASAISGVDYGIDNLNDVYSAIHVIQTQMGITGTTAKEAASTISGSLAMTKAAWQNVLTGIADENADFGGLIDNLVESASAFSGNILPRIGQALQGVGQLVTGLAPVITAALPALVTDVLPGLLDSGAKMLSGIATGIFDALPQIYDAGIALVADLAGSIAANAPTLIPSAVTAITTLAAKMTDPQSVATIINSAMQIIAALATGLLNSLPTLVAQAPVLIANLVRGIINALPQIRQAGREIINTAADALIASLGKIVDAGKNLVRGLWNGITSMGSWLRDKINGWAESIVGWVCDKFGIASPSKVFAGIGGNLTAGLWKGWDSSFPRVMDAIDADLGGITANAFDLTGSASYTAALAPAGVGYAAPQNDGIVGMVTSIYGMLVEIRDTIPDRLGIDGREVSDVVDRYLGIKAVRKERGN